MTAPARTIPAGFPPARATIVPAQVALHLVLLTQVWRVQDLVPGLSAIKLPTVAALVAVVLAILDPRVMARFHLARRHPAARVIPWILAFAITSVVFSIAIRPSLDFLAKGLIPALALVFLVPACTFAPRDAVRFAGLQVLGAAVYCATVLFQFDVDASGRLATLVYYDSNDLGMLLVCTLPLCAYFALRGSTLFTRAIAVGVAILFLLTIGQSGSRGAFVGLLVVGAFLLMRLRSVRLTTRVLLVLATTAALLIGGGGQYRSMMATILEPTKDYNWASTADQGRMNIWKRGLGYAADRPITGVGLAAFPVAEGTRPGAAREQEYGRGVKWSAAHNSFLQIMAELGIPALLALILLLVRSARSAMRLARDAPRLSPSNAALADLSTAHAAGIVGFAVSGFFLSQAYAPYLYFMIGMIVGLDLTIRMGRRPAALPRAARSAVVPEWRSRRVRPAPLPAPETRALP